MKWVGVNEHKSYSSALLKRRLIQALLKVRLNVKILISDINLKTLYYLGVFGGLSVRTGGK